MHNALKRRGALALAFLSVLVVEILRFLCLIDLNIFPTTGSYVFRARAAKGGENVLLYVKNQVGLIKILHDLKRRVLRSQLLVRSGCGEMTF